MTKAETINALKEYERRYWEYEKSYNRCKSLSAQIEKCKKPYREKERPKYTFGRTLIQYSFILFFEYWIFEETALGQKSPLLCILIAAVGFVVFLLYRKASVRKRTDEIIAENAKRHSEWSKLQQARPEYEEQLRKERERQQILKKQAMDHGNYCGLRGDYLNPHIVKRLIHYLETGRCDSLKEALNMYEAEKREDRRDRETRLHRAELERYAAEGASAAREAARSAEDAAYWSTASAFAAFYTAANIGKNTGSGGEYHVV